MKLKLLSILVKLSSTTFLKRFVTALANEVSFYNSDNLIAIARLNIESAVRSEKEQAVVFEFYNAHESFKDITPEELSGGAKDVYNFCKESGFEPKFLFQHDKDWCHCFKILVKVPRFC